MKRAERTTEEKDIVSEARRMRRVERTPEEKDKSEARRCVETTVSMWSTR
jgi:hypothetical protein